MKRIGVLENVAKAEPVLVAYQRLGGKLLMISTGI
jgi:hypothetical protein